MGMVPAVVTEITNSIHIGATHDDTREKSVFVISNAVLSAATANPHHTALTRVGRIACRPLEVDLRSMRPEAMTSPTQTPSPIAPNP